MTLDQGVAADLIQPIIRFNRLNRSRQEGPTAWRQNWRAACPIEQYEAELIFQRLHLHGHGRLRASDRTGCRGERAAFRDGQKGAEIANRHNHLHKISRLRSTYFNFFKSKASRTWLTTITGGGAAARLQPSWLRRVGRGRGHSGAALSKGEALQYCNEGDRAEGDSVAFGCFCAGRKFA
jgi:hypothetical protein